MRHRHLRTDPDASATDLPAAAVVDILARGDLDDWRPIAAEVARDPRGPFAEQVMRLVDAYPTYGVSPLWRAWIDRRRAMAAGSRRHAPPVDLATLRRSLGLTQVQLATRLGMSQSDLSKLERRRDVRLSSLRAYLEALSGRLRLVFEGEEESFEIRFREG